MASITSVRRPSLKFGTTPNSCSATTGATLARSVAGPPLLRIEDRQRRDRRRRRTVAHRDLDPLAVRGDIRIEHRETDRPYARTGGGRGDDAHLAAVLRDGRPVVGSGLPLDLERLEPLRGVLPSFAQRRCPDVLGVRIDEP